MIPASPYSSITDQARVLVDQRSALELGLRRKVAFRPVLRPRKCGCRQCRGGDPAKCRASVHPHDPSPGACPAPMIRPACSAKSGSARLNGNGPVFTFQALHTLEFSLVGRYQNHVAGAGLSRNQEIVRPNRASNCLQAGFGSLLPYGRRMRQRGRPQTRFGQATPGFDSHACSCAPRKRAHTRPAPGDRSPPDCGGASARAVEVKSC